VNLATLIAAACAFAVGAVIPRGKQTLQRLAFGLVGALTMVFVIAIWPSETPVTLEEANQAASKEWPHLLSFLVGVPVVGAAAVLFIPRQALRTLRYFTYAVMVIVFVASLWLLAVPMTGGWHFQIIKDWVPSLGIRYHVAVDGISLWLILLTTFITPIAIFASFGSIKERVKELCFAFLLLEGAMIGAFVALDLFLFYVFWELMLVPMLLMIGIWGGVDKIKAAIKFFLYTMAGSVLMLAAIIYLVWTYQKITGHFSFDYLTLARVVLPAGPANLCFWAFSLAFFIKVPMWPVHTWLPDAHVQAPTGGSVILAAVMLKLGTYAYMRFSMGLFPERAAHFSANLAGIAILGGIIYAALVAWKQGDVKRLVAYSSVAHLGYIMLGLFGASPSGMQGAVLQMVNHGISTGALFLLVGVIYDRRHTRLVEEFGGIAKVMPVYATLFLIVTFASVGVPGTNGFVGEFMVVMGTYVSERLSMFSGVHTVGAAAGVILAAVYMLSVVQKVFFGPLTNPKNKHLKDITPRETLALAPLVVMVFVIGFFPNLFLDRMKDSVMVSYRALRDVSAEVLSVQQMGPENDAKLLPPVVFPAEFLKGAPDEEKKPEAPPEAAAKTAAADTQPNGNKLAANGVAPAPNGAAGSGGAQVAPAGALAVKGATPGDKGQGPGRKPNGGSAKEAVQ
jgi:NADH-quinone oxidoreductase subunit M